MAKKEKDVAETVVAAMKGLKRIAAVAKTAKQIQRDFR